MAQNIKKQHSKLAELLRSRRFWTVVLTVSGAIAVEGLSFEPEQIERINHVVLIVASVYIGGLSLEDAVKQLGGLDNIVAVLVDLLHTKK